MKMKMKQTNVQNRNRDCRIFLIVLGAILIGTLFLAGTGFAAEAQTQARMELPSPEIPQPQPFCGYCHILTYPKVVQKEYTLWKKSKHNEVGCVECHYPPKSKTAASAKAGHIPSQPPGRFSYISLGGETIQTKPHISDASCLNSNCHGKPDDKFRTKEIKFTEKVRFIHKPHFDKKNQIEGQQLHCTSCHQHQTDQKKFEVSKTVCVLCHFKNSKFNQDRAKCELCHQLPKKPIQTSGEKPITHKMLKEAKVACLSCHIEMIRGMGNNKYEAYFENGTLKTTLVMDAGGMKKESCSNCHDQTAMLKEAGNKKLMHEKHVAIKTARCLDCHQPIRHVKAVLKLDDKPDGEATTRVTCKSCHFGPHRYQRMLAEGQKMEGVPKTPDFMYRVRTSCLGCHIEKHETEHGQRVLKASGKACVRCHTKDHAKMLKDWKSDLAQIIKDAEDEEKEALEALSEAKAKLSKEDLAEAEKMIRDGREKLKIVRSGNGVHNKKYAMLLLDAAMTNFEDLLDMVEEE